MKPHLKTYRYLIGLIVIFYGCFTGAIVMGQGSSTDKLHSDVAMEMTEHAHDGPFTVPVDRIVQVDANSDLLLNFDAKEIQRIEASDGVSSNVEWKRVNELLSTVKSLEKERNHINESRLTIDLRNSQQVTDYREKVRTFNLKVNSLLTVNGLRSYGFEDLSTQELDQILLGTFDGGAPEPSKLYQNLARWLNEEIKKLRSDTAVFQKSLNRMVEVQALHEPRVGEAKYLHIDGYDNLPAGDFQPIDRKGLNMTPAEQKRLSAEIKMAKAAAKSIREIQGQGAEAKATIRGVLQDFKNQLNPLKQALDEQPKAWGTTIDSLLLNLKQIRDAAQSGARKSAASQGIVVIENMQNIVNGLRETQELQDIIEIFKSGDLELVLVGPTNLFGKIKEYKTRLTGMKNAAKKLPVEVQKLGAVLGNLPSGTQGSLNQFVSQQATALLNQFATTIPASMPQTQAAVRLVLEVLGGSLPGIQASDTLKEPQAIPRSVDNLVPARVELTKAGLTLGDRISVKVRMYNQTDGDNSQKTSEKQVTYKVEAALMGLHRRIGADLIFARGFGSSMARDWKPNVAARAEWHYLFRKDPALNKQPTREKTWNWIDPGVGLHLANLDQGTDSVEIGIGINISFWEGLLSGGYGHNLGTDRQYIFIGLNLLNVLNQARDSFSFN